MLIKNYAYTAGISIAISLIMAISVYYLPEDTYVEAWALLVSAAMLIVGIISLIGVLVALEK